MEQNKRKKYLVIDPGLRNLTVIVCSIGPQYLTEGVIMESVLNFDIKNDSLKYSVDFNKLSKALKKISTLAMGSKLDEILIEKQFCHGSTGSQTLVWIEGVLYGELQNSFHHQYIHLIPALNVKREFNIYGHNYIENKKAALDTARFYSARVETDHEADCVLIGLYRFLKSRNEIPLYISSSSSEEDTSDESDYEYRKDIQFEQNEELIK